MAVNYREHGGNADAAKAIVQSFATEGMPVAADVSKREDVERMVADIVAEIRPAGHCRQQRRHGDQKAIP